MAVDPRKCIIGTPDKPARSSFMFCRTLKEPEEGDGPAKGSCAILFSKSDKASLKKVKAAIQAAGEKKFGAKFNPDSRKYNNPLRDGDELADDPEYSVGDEARGMWFISSGCYKVPQLVDRNAQRVIDPESVEEMMVSGNYFLFSVTFKGFDNESKGVRAELNNVMFIKEGERLDGSASAEQDFDSFAMDDDIPFGDDDDDDDDEPTPRKKSKKKKSAPVDDDDDDDDAPAPRRRKKSRR